MIDLKIKYAGKNSSEIEKFCKGGKLTIVTTEEYFKNISGSDEKYDLLIFDPGTDNDISNLMISNPSKPVVIVLREGVIKENFDFGSLVVLPAPFGILHLENAAELAGLKFKNKNDNVLRHYFANLIRNSTDITAIIDADGIINFISPSVEKVLGFKTADLLGESVFVLINKSDGQQLKEILSEKNQVDNKSQTELRIHNRNGGTVYLDAIINNCIEDPVIGGFIINARDITERKKAEIIIKKEKESFNEILQNAPFAVALMDASEKFEFVNNEFEYITGFSINDTPTLDFWLDAVFPDTPYNEKNKKYYKRLPVNSKLFKSLKIKTRSGEIKDIEYRMNLQKDGSKVMTFRDITEFKKSETALGNSLDLLAANKYMIENRNKKLADLNERLSKSEKELTELNASKDKFFSIISHDLRAPFNALLGLSSLVVEEVDNLEKPDIKKMVTDINEVSNHLFSLLENLLSWSRFNSGLMHFNPEKIELHELCNGVSKSLIHNAKNKEIEIVNCIKKNEHVKADQKMLNSILQNLISNSIKFTDRGGHISIYAERADEYFFRIAVEDTGVGIREENLPSLFEIDVNNSTYGTENEKGSGLGLILCKEFVEKNGGEISVSSKIGEGTRFDFTLPAYRENS